MTDFYADTSINNLSRLATVTVASDGTATARLLPGVGEYWAISSVRVSTGIMPQTTTLVSYPYCAIYQGSPGVTDASTFLDDTILGSGDSSSIISSTITQYGQAITAKWKNAQPGDVAVLAVFGRVSKDLVSLQDKLAPVPGVRFSGTTANAVVWDYNANVQTSGNMSAPPQFVTPSDSYIELITAHMLMTTDATVATRYVGLRATSGINFQTVDMFRVYNETGGQTAGTTFSHTWSQGINNYNVATNIGTAIPSRLFFPPISTIIIFAASLGAGDTWSSFNLTYRRLTSLTKVTFS